MKNNVEKTLQKAWNVYKNPEKYMNFEKDRTMDVSIEVPDDVGNVDIYEYEKITSEETMVYQKSHDESYEHVVYVHHEDSRCEFGIVRIGSKIEIYVINQWDQVVTILTIHLPGEMTDIKDIYNYVENFLDKGRLYVV